MRVFRAFASLFCIQRPPRNHFIHLTCSTNSGGTYRNLKTFGLSNELFELTLQPAGGTNRNLSIAEVRMVGKSDAKGCTWNLGRYNAASLTCVKDTKRAERILGFQHSGMYLTGSGLNGTLTRDITIVKLVGASKSVMFNTVRADTAMLPHFVPGETLQTGCVPPPLIGHQLTLIKSASNGKYRALLR